MALTLAQPTSTLAYYLDCEDHGVLVRNVPDLPVYENAPEYVDPPGYN